MHFNRKPKYKTIDNIEVIEFDSPYGKLFVGKKLLHEIAEVGEWLIKLDENKRYARIVTQEPGIIKRIGIELKEYLDSLGVYK